MIQNEDINERSKVQQAYAMYERLLAEAEKKLNAALKNWEKLQDELAAAKMMEFAASCDDTILLADEKRLLEEMNDKLKGAQDNIDFWRNRVQKLKQYENQVPSFLSRLESDIELHRLRLNLSRRVG